MSLLYSIVFATRCSSNHHRLAVDALRRLSCRRAEAWRNLILHHHAEYLEGAKAPDNLFKDFKNHVLHVREGEWGGAIGACEEWYGRTVSALKERDWAQAAWSAGVLSHYYVDPIQPFHTHQTEEEGVIHAAVERSFSKSYRRFQEIIEGELGGYPVIVAPEGGDWLAAMVREGAHASNPFYETVLDHFDVRAAVKDPQAGLDDTLRFAIAGLVAHAVSGFAAILDRAIEESGARPPELSGDLQAFFLALEAPIKAVLSKIEDERERALISAQYQEFRKTGKVRETLRDDDKAVRALHAAEVLNVSLSTLDARWPRQIGRAHGQALAEPPPSPVPSPPPPAAPATPPPRRTRAAAAPAAEPPPPSAMAGPLPESAPPESAPPETAPQPAPAAPPPPAPREEALAEGQAEAIELHAAFLLTPDHPVIDAPSIGPKTARRLEAVGVFTVGDLLSLTPAAGAVLIDQRHIGAEQIADWQAQARLACTVAGLRSREAQALVACGIRSAEELVTAQPEILAQDLEEWATSAKAARIWGAAPPPKPDDVAQWIEHARGVTIAVNGMDAPV